MDSFNCCFSADDGILRTEERALIYPGLTRSEWVSGPGQHTTSRDTGPGFVIFSGWSVQLWGQRFLGDITFFRDVVYGAMLTLEQGKVARLGYDATEKDLLAEKKKLTAIVSQQLSCSPSSSSLGADVFEFPWGGVLSRADLKSTWCYLEVRYLSAHA